MRQLVSTPHLGYPQKRFYGWDLESSGGVLLSVLGLTLAVSGTPTSILHDPSGWTGLGVLAMWHLGLKVGFEGRRRRPPLDGRHRKATMLGLALVKAAMSVTNRVTSTTEIYFSEFSVGLDQDLP